MGAELEPDAADRMPLSRQLCRYLSERSPQPMVAVEGTTHAVIYVNPAFNRLVGRESKALVGRSFAEAVPEGAGNGCLALLDRVFRTGTPEKLAEQEHRQSRPEPVYWSYAVWAILGTDERPRRCHGAGDGRDGGRGFPPPCGGHERGARPLFGPAARTDAGGGVAQRPAPGGPRPAGGAGGRADRRAGRGERVAEGRDRGPRGG